MKKFFLLILILSFSFTCYSIVVLPSSGPYIPGQVIQFKSSNPAYSKVNGTWDFGDGSPYVTVLDPYNYWTSHVYTSTGTYKVYLNDPAGIRPQELLVITIQAPPPPSSIVTDHIGPYGVGEVIGFNKTCHDPSRGTSNWNFGDGATIYLPTDINYGWQYHTYSSPGTYMVQYTHGTSISTYPVCGSGPAAYTDSIMITIVALPPTSSIVTDHSSPYIVGEVIGFNKTCHDPSRGTSTWNFGDGTTRTYPDDNNRGWQYHTYSFPGTFTIQYIHGTAYSTPVCGSSGAAYSDNITITIKARPVTKYITLSPPNPHTGELIIFTANNFSDPDNIRWEMGDGTVLNRRSGGGRITAGAIVTHIYQNQGKYVIRAYDGGSTSSTPVIKEVTILGPIRNIQFTPNNPMVDHPVHFHASGFVTQQIDWNFGDGKFLSAASPYQTHRFQIAGTFMVSAKDSSVNHTPVSTNVTVLPDNRFIEVSAPEVRQNDPVTVTANNFIGDLILWDFGDGTRISAGQTVVHVYERAGTYTITARDENGEGEKVFQLTVKIIGITDEVNLEIAEIKLDNGKYYKVVSKNSKDLRAVLKMKMRGTGIVTGYWMIDGVPFEFINDVAVQGELMEIYTREIPGIPTIEPGLHTISLQLTRPSTALTFATLKYFVLPYENKVETISPPDGFVTKEKDIPEFRWREPKGGTKYEIAFANYLYKFIYNKEKINWIDVGLELKFKPGEELWKGIKRNHWSYWQVRSLDSNKNVIAEGDINELKVVIATAEITINSVSDLEGNKIELGKSGIKSQADILLVKGSVEYKGNSKYLVLRVYLDDEMVDQLLFRNVEKGDVRKFETSIPNKGKGKVVFRVLKTSSPSVIIGIKGLNIKK